MLIGIATRDVSDHWGYQGEGIPMVNMYVGVLPSWLLRKLVSSVVAVAAGNRPGGGGEA